MPQVEKAGLLKMDFLGLKTLTVIDDAQKLVRKHRKLPKFNIEKVGFEDAKTFALLNDAKTVGVFQLESGGMQSLCRQFNISAIDEIVALIALYRPGPMQFIPDYIKGKKDPNYVKYAHPLLEKVAKICKEVVEFGPLNATSHKIDECVIIDDVEPLKNIYRKTLEQLIA